MSFFLERGVGAYASRVKVYRISRSPDASSARIVPDTIGYEDMEAFDQLQRIAGIGLLEATIALLAGEGAKV